MQVKGRWQICHVSFLNKENLDNLLRDGWEPFSVTKEDRKVGYAIWLRRWLP